MWAEKNLRELHLGPADPAYRTCPAEVVAASAARTLPGRRWGPRLLLLHQLQQIVAQRQQCNTGYLVTGGLASASLASLV